MSDPRVVRDARPEPLTAGYPGAPRVPADRLSDSAEGDGNVMGARSSDPKAGQFVAKDAAPNALAGSPGFEGFVGQTDLPASGDVLTTRRGDLDAQPAPGNGKLPPGAVETPGYPTSHFKSKPLPNTYV